MKKFSILALALVLTASLMTGCRNNSDGDNASIGDTTAPTSKPTEATKPTAAPTRPTDPTMPSTEASTPSGSNGSGMNGGTNGGATGGTGSGTGSDMQSPTGTVDSTTATGRGRPSNR